MPTETRIPPPPNARLVLTRNSEDDVRNRQIFASLDGVSIGDMLFGEQIVKEIVPGPHRLRIHNTLFWRTFDFTAAPGQELRFQTVNYAGRGFLNMALIFGVAPLFLRVNRIH